MASSEEDGLPLKHKDMRAPAIFARARFLRPTGVRYARIVTIHPLRPLQPCEVLLYKFWSDIRQRCSINTSLLHTEVETRESLVETF